MDDSTYREGLPTAELIDHIDRLLCIERHIEHLVCRYLADLADRIATEPYDSMRGYADIHHAARCLFGMSERRVRERVRIGRALRELRHIEAAFVSGVIGFSRVRELTRVAKPEDQEAWLALARALPVRQLEQRVAEAADAKGYRERAAEKAREPATLSWTSPQTVQVTLSMPSEGWALLQRAMEGARAASDVDGATGVLTDAEALSAVARDALARQAEHSDDSSDPRRNVVLYECQSCRRTELETGVGPILLEPAAAAALGCSAKVRDLRTEGRVVARGGEVPAAVKRAVRLRDRNHCRVPGCTRRRYVEVHHIEGRAAGGVHSRSNCCLLCSTCHGRLHAGDLRVEGDGDAELLFFDRAGEPVRDPDGSRPDGETAAQRCILDTMGLRGGWHPDALLGATGLELTAQTDALLALRLAGRIGVDLAGTYHPTRRLA